MTANGRFPVSVSNALGYAAENWYSGAFGMLLQSRDANGLESRTEYDGFGRPIRTVQADGRQQVVQYRDCTEAGLSCPARAARAILTDRTGSASVVNYLDRRGLVVRTETEGFDGTTIHQDTVYDAAGQAVRKTRAYYAGEMAQWSRYTYDKLGRVKSETLPNGNVTETNYDGLEGGWIRETATRAGVVGRTGAHDGAGARCAGPGGAHDGPFGERDKFRVHGVGQAEEGDGGKRLGDDAEFRFAGSVIVADRTRTGARRRTRTTRWANWCRRRPCETRRRRSGMTFWAG